MTLRTALGVALCFLVLAVGPGTARASSPTITTVWPRRAPVGAPVLISGSGLADTTAVSFNGVAAASFTVRSDSRVRAIVPSGATTGPIRLTADGHTVSSPNPITIQPNIVLILTDDQRYDELDHMPVVQNELIDKGTQFTNGFVVNPLCCPSRTTILTGKYSHGTDVYSNIPPNGGFQTFVTSLHEDRHTVATWLQSAGYETGLVGKYLNGYTAKKTAYVSPGWNTWDVLANPGADGGYFNFTLSINGVNTPSTTGQYSTDVLSTYAHDFITNAPAGKPFFLFFAPKAPHPPATPPPRYADAFPDLAPLRPPSYNEADVSDKPGYIKAVSPWPDSQQSQQDAFRRRQYQSLLAVDDAVANIMDALQTTGRLEDTLILFASDNGLSIGEHRWANKKAPYEEDIRIPIIARYDALMHQTASTDPHLLLNLDFAPTFAAAGGTTSPGAEGANFLPLLNGTSNGWRTDFLIEHADSRVVTVPTYCAVRNEQYIYVEYSSVDSLGNREEELYNIQSDPYELDNLLVTDPANPNVITTRLAMHDRMVQLCSPPPPGFTP